MTPQEFKEQNVVFGKDQPQYNPLPAFVDKEGIVVTCWELTKEERKLFLKTGKIYIQQMTFNKGLNPILPSIEPPFK
jgi:hypothetical protein